MNKLTIIGLGPGSKEYLTMDAFDVLMESELVHIRTLQHPVVDYLISKGVNFSSYDSNYETHDKFEEVYDSIVEDVLEKLKSSDVVYAVPGNPFVAELTVEKLIEKVDEENLKIVHGTSFIDAIVTTLRLDPVYGLKIIDGLAMDVMIPEVTSDCLVIQVYNQTVASNVKLELMKYYSDDQEVIVVRGAGIKEEQVIKYIPLYELDRVDCLDHLTSIYIKRVEKDKRDKFFMKDLSNIMLKLRSLDGCPWDREQTHESLRKYLIEEAYEVIEAIDSGDLWSLEEELGDLLLQVVFHAEIASENGYFDINDVITGIYEKMVRRHPHVFSDVDVIDSDEVLVNWEEIKNEEKDDFTVIGNLERIAKSFPPILRAEKIQSKLGKVGFEWPDVSGAIEKLEEELNELKEAINNNNSEEILKELGDLLFSIVNVSRYLKVDPSEALNKTSDKVISRFAYVEEKITERGEKLGDVSLETMDKIWENSKKMEF